MNELKALEILGEIDDTQLGRALAYRPVTRAGAPTGAVGRRKAILHWGSLAACLCLLAVILIRLLPVKVNAAFEIEDGILLAYHGDAKEVVLPDEVRAIADYAFSEDKNLEKLTLNEDVTSIGACAFTGCRYLSEIIVPAGNTAFVREDDTVFSADHCLIVRYLGDATRVVVPESVLFIASEAFAGTPVREFVLHDRIRFVGLNAFDGTPAYESGQVRYSEEAGIPRLTDGTTGLNLLSHEAVGDLFGWQGFDSVSVCGNVVTSYQLDRKTNEITVYRFGNRGKYYEKLSFIPDGDKWYSSYIWGNFWSETEGVVAVECEIRIRYDAATGTYSVTDSDMDSSGYGLAAQLFFTEDGGLTWTLGGYTAIHPALLGGYHLAYAGFVNRQVGVAGGRLRNPELEAEITFDGGLTWEALSIAIPESYGAPEVCGLEEQAGDYRLKLRFHSEGTETYRWYISSDGRTWAEE